MSESLAAAQVSAAARGMDLATAVGKAGGLGLISLVAEASTTAGIQVVKWLARERLNEEAFLQTMRAYQDFAHPNTNGQVILAQLQIGASKLFGLQLVMPGALGSTILRDKELRWVATTEAVMLKYHLPAAVEKTFIDIFLMRAYPNESRQSRLFFAKEQIHAVVQKMTDSIHLHTVNAGLEISPLPEEFEKFVGHRMVAQDFARAVHSIQERSGTDIVVQVKYFAADLLCWIYNHWDGVLAVSMQGKLVFDKVLGTSPETLTFFVVEIPVDKCLVTTNSESCRNTDHVLGFRIGGRYGSTFDIDPKTAWNKGFHDHGGSFTSGTRIPLYGFMNPHSGTYLSLNKKELNMALSSAQRIVASLMDTTVYGTPLALRFKLNDKEGRKFKWWVRTSPTILQQNLGNDKIVPFAFLLDDVDRPEKDRRGGVEYPAHEIILRFSDVMDALAVARDRCECGCDSNEKQDFRGFRTLQYDRLNDGCIQTHMFTQIMLLLGNAFAEAAGAKDISNLRGEESHFSLVKATMHLLVDLIQTHHVQWETWFRLAASAITGLPFDLALNTTFIRLIFWQAGPMTIVPLWFNFDQEINLESSWGVQTVRGNIQGIESEWAVVASEDTLAGDDGDEERPKPEFVSGGSVDDSSCNITYAIFPKTEYLYSQMMMVRTEGSIRALSPSDIYFGLVNTQHPSCNHEVHAEHKAQVHPYTFSDVAIKWSMSSNSSMDQILNIPDGQEPIPHIALLQDNWLKSNIAIGFQGDVGFGIVRIIKSTIQVFGLG
ncbi:hypothetical protein GLAREA_08730 [Glarea lozoyensis ATCC 20868]|uniref:Uncharacterized protein n=1 Tax=Glarea lozoyensis (strain ATCC 20868 / MF5171) TaxID=1116229 RepID=S3DDQ6_GLAL2|nr:uncharacterized protein GLAREA_08730 [Glarea lozoyensis ATCC 20868]EPE36567.1 hypothetical protein GLAREA_08730 [Glarea lozoyensis ATCC 20868]